MNDIKNLIKIINEAEDASNIPSKTKKSDTQKEYKFTIEVGMKEIAEFTSIDEKELVFEKGKEILLNYLVSWDDHSIDINNMDIRIHRYKSYSSLYIRFKPKFIKTNDNVIIDFETK